MKAFTLIELVVTIIILAIIAVVAVPRITDIIQNRQLVAARKIQADLRWAQQFAVNKNCRTRVAFNAGAESYTVSENTSLSFVTATDPTTNSSFTVTLNTGQYAGVEISSVSFDGQNTVEFDPLGKPYASDGTGSPPALAATGTVSLPNSISITVTPETGKVSVTP